MVNRWKMRDIPRLVLDANIMVSALAGRSFPLLLALFEKGVLLLSPAHQLAETRKTLSEKFDVTENWVDLQMERLNTVVMPLHPALFDKHEEVAKSRLHQRGQPDWPVLAASMETASAVWSHDKDFFGSGVAVWSTTVLRKQLEMADV
jgi:predicted nucleic acid-binding protein